MMILSLSEESPYCGTRRRSAVIPFTLFLSLYNLQTSAAWLLHFKDHSRVRIIKLPTEKYTKGGLTVKEITSWEQQKK